MTLIARRPQSTEQERLRGFVAEQLDALEPGLTLLETGLRLGRTVVDVVAGDAKQRLVLIGVGPVATEALLLAMLDAFIWCVQFPENLRRLYPDARLVFSRPPRLLIVAEQVPASVLELVGQLSMVEVDCHEVEAAGRAEAITEPATEPAVDREHVPGLEHGAVIPETAPEVAPSAADETAREEVVAVAPGASTAAGGPQTPETEAPAVEPQAELLARAAWARNANGHHAGNGALAAASHAADGRGGAAVAEEDVSWATSGAEQLMAETGDGRPAAPTPHPMLASLSFPKGTVSRQWQEFLNRLASGQ